MKKYAIFLRGMTVPVYAGPDTPEEEILKEAAKEVKSFPAKPTGRPPIYTGADRWLVGLNDVPLGVVEADSKKEAIAIKREQTGELEKDMRAEPVADA
ncbi:hypothetical protein MYX06_02450 [Patescibacteria group bacterium AH-259-L05]|nr:hypothetical protein [Patescibacteria group bacterium AH-259-L05]